MSTRQERNAVTPASDSARIRNKEDGTPAAIAHHTSASSRGSRSTQSARACAAVASTISKPATNTNGAALATTSFTGLRELPDVFLLQPSLAPSPLCRIHPQTTARLAHSAGAEAYALTLKTTS